MLVPGELKGELARIHPARACCRRAELAGLAYGDSTVEATGAGRLELRTLDPATARVAVHLAGGLGALHAQSAAPSPVDVARRTPRVRRRLRVAFDASTIREWSWATAPPCDRRAFVRGLLLGSGSVSLSRRGAHIEFVFRDRRLAEEARRRLEASEVRAALLQRRGRRVLYVKGREEVATLLRLTGANRGLLDFETDRVTRDVRNRLNRLLNAEEANLSRTVVAAGRQLHAIARLDRSGRLAGLSEPLRAAARVRRVHPDADLDAIATLLGVSRSAANHRLRRLVELADELDDGAQGPAKRAGDATAARRG